MWGLKRNDGSCWPRSDGKWIWWAVVEGSVLESVARTRPEAVQEARNAERELEARVST